jgi:Lrp/AsnC family leucine-responsive transcriptional regulator
MNSRRFEKSRLDAVDVTLLRALAENARLPIAELARRVGLSAPSVAERLRRLEAAGVITGYGLEIDPRALGLSLTAWLRIRPLPGKLARVAELVRELPEIVECDRITGDDCFLARAQLRSVEALEALIDRILPYATTNTAIVQSSPVTRRLPPLSPGA